MSCCGGSNDTISSHDAKLNSKTSGYFSKVGVKLCLLKAFIKNNGGDSNFMHKTTEEVCKEYIKPLTKKTGQSFCEQYARDLKYGGMISESVAWFICHAHKRFFLDVINNITSYLVNLYGEQKAQDTVLWIDIFSCNQNKVNSSNDWLSDAFITGIGNIGKTLVVMDKWENTDILGRTWCMYDLFAGQQTDVKVQIAMSNMKLNEFASHLIDDPDCHFLKALASKKIKTQLSSTTNHNDFDMIQTFVTKKLPGGFPELDRLVYGIFNTWIKSFLQDKMSECLAKDDNGSLASYQYALANIYFNESNFEAAQPLYVACLTIQKNVLGYGHPRILVSTMNLATIYSNSSGKENSTKEKQEEAESLYTTALEIQRNTLAEGHPAIITSTARVADMYRAQNKMDKAEPLYLDLLELRVKQLGDDHVDVLSTLNTLAEIYKTQNKLQETELLYLHTLETYNQKASLSPVSNNKLSIMNNLAALYKSQGKLTEAEILYKEVLDIRMKFLGQDNANTLLSMHNLASLYNAQQRYDEAEEYYLKCLDTRRRVLGNDHASTITSIHSLGVFYQDRGRSEEATILLEEIKDKKGGSSRNTNASNKMMYRAESARVSMISPRQQQQMLMSTSPKISVKSGEGSNDNNNTAVDTFDDNVIYRSARASTTVTQVSNSSSRHSSKKVTTP